LNDDVALAKTTFSGIVPMIQHLATLDLKKVFTNVTAYSWFKKLHLVTAGKVVLPQCKNIFKINLIV